MSEPAVFRMLLTNTLTVSEALSRSLSEIADEYYEYQAKLASLPVERVCGDTPLSQDTEAEDQPPVDLPKAIEAFLDYQQHACVRPDARTEFFTLKDPPHTDVITATARKINEAESEVHQEIAINEAIELIREAFIRNLYFIFVHQGYNTDERALLKRLRYYGDVVVVLDSEFSIARVATN